MNDKMYEGVRLLDTLINAFNYNRTAKCMLSILVELKGRLNGTFPCNFWSDDCNIIYSSLVLRCGEYGTSPKKGWFEEEIFAILMCEIDTLIVEFNRRYELEKEEEGEE